MIDFLKIFWALSSERACCSSSYIWDRSGYHFMCKLQLLYRSNFSIYLHFLAISILCRDRKALFKEVVQDLLWCKHLIYCHGSTRSYTHVCHLCPTVMHYMLCCHLQLLPNWLLGSTFAATICAWMSEKLKVFCHILPFLFVQPVCVMLVFNPRSMSLGFIYLFHNGIWIDERI